MKKSNIIYATLPLIILSGCNTTEPIEKEHVHVYDQKVAAIQYGATGTSCCHGSTYYYSCVCGAKGTETFEYGETLPHNYKLVVHSAETFYATGDHFNVSSINASLICNDCKHEEPVETSKIEFVDKELTSTDKNVKISVKSNEKTLSFDLPICVTAETYKINKADIYENNLGKAIFKIEGTYDADSKEKIESAELYLSPNKNIYKYASTNFVLTPESAGANKGTFIAELDITDMPLSNKSNVIDSFTKDNVYWPHLMIKNSQEIYEDKPLFLPLLQSKEIKLAKDPTNESYAMRLYSDSANNSYVPVVARMTTNEKPTFTYAMTTTDTTYTIPANVEKGYMPTGVDIENKNGRAIWTLSGKYKGFTRSVDFLRCFSIYFYCYPNNKDDLAYYASYNGLLCNYLPLEDGLTFVETANKQGTFKISFDITDYEVPTNTPYQSYFTRVSGTGASGIYDCKCADTINDGKSITIGEKKYTVMNAAKNAATYANGWSTMSFKIETIN